MLQDHHASVSVFPVGRHALTAAADYYASQGPAAPVRAFSPTSPTATPCPRPARSTWKCAGIIFLTPDSISMASSISSPWCRIPTSCGRRRCWQ
ncbi:MAG: hypothetical protein WKG07_37325 [Hymenobacter sp.]